MKSEIVIREFLDLCIANENNYRNLNLHYLADRMNEVIDALNWILNEV